ncbi:MAG: hypothetical protein AB7R89_17720 [Dehalococcoidia bacterium]
MKVIIQSEDTSLLKPFGCGNQGSICQIHWPVLILLHQFGHPIELAFAQVMQQKPAISPPPPQFCLRRIPAGPEHKIHRFREARPGCEEGLAGQLSCGIHTP